MEKEKFFLTLLAIKENNRNESLKRAMKFYFAQVLQYNINRENIDREHGVFSSKSKLKTGKKTYFILMEK